MLWCHWRGFERSLMDPKSKTGGSNGESEGVRAYSRRRDLWVVRRRRGLASPRVAVFCCGQCKARFIRLSLSGHGGRASAHGPTSTAKYQQRQFTPDFCGGQNGLRRYRVNMLLTCIFVPRLNGRYRVSINVQFLRVFVYVKCWLNDTSVAPLGRG